MDREQEEAVSRITARYVAEVQAGLQPRLSDYIARYPQYADAIADFVAYYHAIEADVPEEITMPAPLSDVSRSALTRAQQRVLQSSPPTQHLTTLLIDKDKQRLTPSQVATELDLSVDIVTLLERRLIDPVTIPQEALRRLATLLGHPASAVQAYLADQQYSMRYGDRQQARVAEDQAQYPVQDQYTISRRSFRQVVDTSEELSSGQKAGWYAILAQEE